ncbi:MAG TPA: FxLYD domain-containing protein [Thermodesulfobacteriota bacterium]|nr:FxLYD domain-containing protein [Thermodesulfobacteriota bacterium]
MKRLILAVFLVVFIAALGCDSPNGNGVVQLDGPILESMDADGNLEFNGAVINTGDAAVKSVYVVIVLKDQDGNVIEANSVSIFDEDPNALLYPSERAFFSLSVSSDPNRVFSKEVEVYYEDSPDNQPSS